MNIQHIFIIGSKSIGQYGGYETFVDKLTEQHQHKEEIQYHIACKANGDGYMDETKLVEIENVVRDTKGKIIEFTYHKANAFKLNVPPIGPAAAIYYDLAALKYSIKYCLTNKIKHPIFYILACRIGPFINKYKCQIKQLGGTLFLNPDGHEWMRSKWSAPVRKYWKRSEATMVKYADLIICDSVNIENYIKNEYKIYTPKTTFIAYGSETTPSILTDEDTQFINWLNQKNIKKNEYYLVVGRLVPENNYETMIWEFMKSKSKKNLVLITNTNNKFQKQLEKKLHFKSDSRIKFVEAVYDPELLKKIRENAYGYLHGHEVGGTNPSLLESLGSTKLNLLLDVGFNREVAQDTALYWKKDDGNLAGLIDDADRMNIDIINELGNRAKKRIQDKYSWKYICNQYEKEFLKNLYTSNDKETKRNR